MIAHCSLLPTAGRLTENPPSSPQPMMSTSSASQTTTDTPHPGGSVPCLFDHSGLWLRKNHHKRSFSLPFKSWDPHCIEWEKSQSYPEGIFCFRFQWTKFKLDDALFIWWVIWQCHQAARSFSLLHFFDHFLFNYHNRRQPSRYPLSSFWPSLLPRAHPFLWGKFCYKSRKWLLFLYLLLKYFCNLFASNARFLKGMLQDKPFKNWNHCCCSLAHLCHQPTIISNLCT